MRAPTPGRRQSPFQRCLLCRLGQGQRGAHRRGSRGQRRVTYQRTRLIKPRSASHGKAAAMRARIAGPSITHSSNKAWLALWGREISARLMLLCLSGNGCCRVDRIACAGVENRGKNRKSTKRCGLDRLNLIYAKRAVARPANGLIRYPRLLVSLCFCKMSKLLTSIWDGRMGKKRADVAGRWDVKGLRALVRLLSSNPKP